MIRNSPTSTPRRIVAALVCCCAAAVATHRACGNEYDVYVTVDSEPGLSVGDAREWYRLLSELGVGRLTISDNGSDPPPQLHVVEGTVRGRIEVQATLSPRGVLIVPGQDLRLGDREKIKAWIDGLRSGSALAKNQPTGPFGLKATDNERVADALSQPVGCSTAGWTADAALARLTTALPIPLVGAASVQRTVAAANDAVEIEQLRGLSLGTATAYLLRSKGLGYTPESTTAGKLQLRVRPIDAKRTADDDTVIWPVGWTPQESKQKTLPKLYTNFEAEVDDFPLTETLAALSQRLEAPVLYDHWALERAGIKLADLRVSQLPKRTAYSLLLRDLLRQVELRYELRVDEAQRPLLWVTTR
ncbi:MAG: hypothetical protein KDA63_03295 [Planctomycetales bacterium]|nr:hypothetical protein [Planctomycetales bacterium]